MVEIKLSTNSKVVAGYERQLEAYKDAEESIVSHYVVIDVGGMGNKDRALINALNERRKKRLSYSEITFIDAERKPSASKL